MFTFGLELEFVATARSSFVQDALIRNGVNAIATYSNQPGAWTVKGDGSIRTGAEGYGHEIVSPILTLPEVFAQSPRVAAAIAELRGTVNESCGFHIHVGGFENLELVAIRNIVRRFVNFEDTLDLLQPVSRRGDANSFCKSNARFIARRAGNAEMSPVERNALIWERVHNCANRESLMELLQGGRDLDRGSRYFKLNLMSLMRHGTIEYRHPSATVDAADMTGMTAFLSKFCEVALHQQRLHRRPMHTPETQADRWAKLMRNQDGPTVVYLRDRFTRMTGQPVQALRQMAA